MTAESKLPPVAGHANGVQHAAPASQPTAAPVPKHRSGWKRGLITFGCVLLGYLVLAYLVLRCVSLSDVH